MSSGTQELEPLSVLSQGARLGHEPLLTWDAGTAAGGLAFNAVTTPKIYFQSKCFSGDNQLA